MSTVHQILHRTAAPTTAAELARALLPWVAEPTAWRARVAAIPVVRTLPPIALDWDALIAEGEAALADPATPALLPLARDRTVPSKGFIEGPLAEAYHQRASRSFERGALADALRDVDRAVALASVASHYTTRASGLRAVPIRTAPTRQRVRPGARDASDLRAARRRPRPRRSRPA